MQLTSNNIKYRWPATESSGAQYSLRKFGSHFCDLGVDFHNTQQLLLVTQIVSNCLLHQDQPIPETEVWAWSLKKRLQALLAITINTGDQELLLHVYCPQSHCGEGIELVLDLNRFSQDAEDDHFSFDSGTQIVTARLPNGIDQQQWMQLQTQSTTDLAKCLIVQVGNEPPTAEWQFPEDWLAGFSESLEQHDELMTLQINSSCPACSRELEIDVDLETQLLSILSHEQRKLLLDVHQIALAYHWSEQEIVGLTTARRNFYLMQLRNLSQGALLQ